MTHLLVVSSHTSQVWRDPSQVLPSLAVADVACAEDLLNLAW